MNGKRLLAAWGAMGLWASFVQAQDAPPVPLDADADAQALVDAALRAAETATGAQLGEDMDAWARSVIEGALSNAPAGGEASSVPAGEHAARVADAVSGEQTNGLPSAGTEVIVFMSLSVPEASWRQWSREAARIGAPMVLRGVKPGGLAETVGEIRRRLGEYGGGDDPPSGSLQGAATVDGAGGLPGVATAPLPGAALDPRLFRLFRVAHVPAVAVVPGGVPPCESRGCTADPAPPHDLVTGNVGLESALDIVAREGGPGRASARRHLALLRGEAN